MKIFEQMKAALEAHAPIGDEPEKVKPIPIATGTQNSSITQVPEYTQPVPFRIGDSVTYRTPVIKTAKEYSWVWHHGTIQEVSQHLELVIITPRDIPQKLISIPFVYVRAYEKNELNELMEVREDDQEGH